LEKKYKYIFIIRIIIAIMLLCGIVYSHTKSEGIYNKINGYVEYTSLHNTDFEKWINKFSLHNIIKR